MPPRSLEPIEGRRFCARLLDLERPPRVLYFVGAVPRRPWVAVVGTRYPTASAVSYATEFTTQLARAGVGVVSGGAEGIDTAAHEGALAAGEPTLVVGGSSLDRPYPEKNATLFERIIASGGGYLSMWPNGTSPRRHQFLQRNQIMAAIVDALVVVEAPLGSGATKAARHCRNLARPLLVVPSVPWNEQGLGCLELLRTPGTVLVRSHEDVLDTLRAMAAHPISRGGPPPDEPRQLPLPGLLGAQAELAAVLGAVRSGAAHVDEICEKTGVPAARVQQAILTLDLKGVLSSDPSGFIRSINH